MATMEYKETRYINPFSNIRFDLGTGSSTLPKKLTPVDIFLDSKRREAQDRQQRINELCKELDNHIDPRVNKETVIKWIKKTDGRYKLETYIKFVAELENSYQKTLEYSWENVAVRSLDTKTGLHVHKLRMNIPVFWTQRDGHKQTFFERVKVSKTYRKNPHECKGYYTESQEIHNRNYSISEIRDKYLSKTKRGLKWYEMHANYYYQSPEAYRVFLKEIEEKGLDNREERKSTYRDRLETLFPQKEYGQFGIKPEDGMNAIDADNFYSTRDKNRFERDFQKEDVERGEF